MPLWIAIPFAALWVFGLLVIVAATVAIIVDDISATGNNRRNVRI